MRRRQLLSGLAAGATAAAWPLPAAAGSVPGTAGPVDFADILAATSEPPPVALDTLLAVLTAARSDFTTCRYDRLGERLPMLIATAAATRRHTRGVDRDQAAVILAAGYRLASELSVKRNDDALGWVFADRALTAARDSGQPLSIAHASRSAAIAMRRAGHHQDAVGLLTTAAGHLEPRPQPTDSDLAAYGALLCTAAYASAQRGDRDSAAVLITEAADTADRLTTTVTNGEITFSPTNVAVYRIGICTALGDSGAALQHAGTVEPARLATAERHARYCIDTARAWELHGRPDGASDALHAAERLAPQELRRPSVRDLITHLLYAPTMTPSGLRDLAVRCGAIP